MKTNEEIIKKLGIINVQGRVLELMQLAREAGKQEVACIHCGENIWKMICINCKISYEKEAEQRGKKAERERILKEVRRLRNGISSLPDDNSLKPAVLMTFKEIEKLLGD